MTLLELICHTCNCRQQLPELEITDETCCDVCASPEVFDVQFSRVAELEAKGVVVPVKSKPLQIPNLKARRAS